MAWPCDGPRRAAAVGAAGCPGRRPALGGVLLAAAGAQIVYWADVAFRRLFTGLDLVPPGLVRVPRWRRDSAEDAATPSTQWGGVARKP